MEVSSQNLAVFTFNMFGFLSACRDLEFDLGINNALVNTRRIYTTIHFVK
jgi:hypothetical protein